MYVEQQPTRQARQQVDISSKNHSCFCCNFQADMRSAGTSHSAALQLTHPSIVQGQGTQHSLNLLRWMGDAAERALATSGRYLRISRAGIAVHRHTLAALLLTLLPPAHCLHQPGLLPLQLVQLELSCRFNVSNVC